MKWSETPPESQELRKGYIEGRWKQLSELELDWGNEGAKYLFLINSGGAVAVLSFLGAIKELRAFTWLYLVLLSFVTGVILIGFLRFFLFHRITWIYRHWRSNSNDYFADKIGWDDLIALDSNKLNKNKLWSVVIAWSAFIVFITGCGIGAINISDLNQGAKSEREKAPIKASAAALATHTPKGVDR